MTSPLTSPLTTAITSPLTRPLGTVDGEGGAWNPAMLGATLIERWSIDDSGLITQAVPPGISTWKGEIIGSSFNNGTPANQPVYSATGWNGLNPGAAFGGVSTVLAISSVPYPAAALPSEIWAVVDQTALVADTTTRNIFTYGGGANTTWRSIQRVVVSGQNRIQATCGTGSNITCTLAADFSGRHAVCGIFDGTTVTAGMDGVLATPVAAVPTTGTTRSRIGANSATTAAAFLQGEVREILITGTTTAAQKALLWAYLASRL